jgi:hypothetical protein
MGPAILSNFVHFFRFCYLIQDTDINGRQTSLHSSVFNFYISTNFQTSIFRFVKNSAFLVLYAVSVLLYLSKFVLLRHVLKFHLLSLL